MKNERFEVKVKTTRAWSSVVRLVDVEAADVARALVEAALKLGDQGIEEWSLVSVVRASSAEG
jgi:hypothetical protein